MTNLVRTSPLLTAAFFNLTAWADVVTGGEFGHAVITTISTGLIPVVTIAANYFMVTWGPKIKDSVFGLFTKLIDYYVDRLSKSVAGRFDELSKQVGDLNVQVHVERTEKESLARQNDSLTSQLASQGESYRVQMDDMAKRYEESTQKMLSRIEDANAKLHDMRNQLQESALHQQEIERVTKATEAKVGLNTQILEKAQTGNIATDGA